MDRFKITRDITKKECGWLHETIKKDTIVYRYPKYTYGCISEGGIAVVISKAEGCPFFEVPMDAIERMQ